MLLSMLLLLLSLGVSAHAISSTPKVTTRYIGIKYTGHMPGYNTWGEVDMIMADGEPVFCMDPLTAVADGQVYNSGEFKNGAFYNARGHKLTDSQVKKIKDIIFWSWDMATSKNDQRYAAVQLMIWETLGTTVDTLTGMSQSDYQWYKDELKKHQTSTVSFNGESVTLLPGQSKTFTDTNGNLKYLSFENKNGWTFKQSGNSVTVIAGNNASDYTVSTLNRKLKMYAKTNLILKKDGAQSLVAFKDPDFVRATLNLKAQKRGFLSWTKVDATTGSSLSGTKWTVQEWDKHQKKYVDYADQSVTYYPVPQPHYGITWPGAFMTGWLTATEKNQGWFRVVEKSAQTGYINNGAAFEANILKAVDGYAYVFRRGTGGEGIAIKKTDLMNSPQPGFLAWQKKASGTGELLSETKWKIQQWSKAKDTYVDMVPQPSITYYATAQPRHGLQQGGYFATDYLRATSDNQGWFKVVESQAQTGYTNNGAYFEGSIITDRKNSYRRVVTENGKVAVIANQPLYNGSHGFMMWPKVKAGTKEALPDTKWKVLEWSKKDQSFHDYSKQQIWFYGEPQPHYGTSEGGYFATDVLEYTDDNEGIFKVVETQAQEGYFMTGEVSFTANISKAGEGYRIHEHASYGHVAIRTGAALTNQPIMGRMKIRKTFDLDKTDTALTDVVKKGIHFSVKNTAGEVVDTLVTNDNGEAESKELPYGTYTVTEEATEANAGYRLIEPFTVEIREHGKVYEYSLSNELKSQKLQIQKVDEKGQVVALAGFAFKIKQADGTFLTQTAQDGTKTDTFTTDESGSITLPQVLAAGNYALTEINTPAGSGYVLNETELPFEIKDDKDVTLTVSFKNESQKGVLKINKTGEQLAGSATEEVTVGGKSYTIVKPVYEARALAGATFELRAEDGSVVQTLTTNGAGENTFDPVPLGKYYLVETATAPGYVLDSTPLEVNFTPQEQTIRFDIQSKQVNNDRQKIKIGFNKTFEESKWFKRSGVTATFGLFAKDDVPGADGTTAIARDSLLAVALVTKEDGKGSFTDITATNRLYIRELATHEAYQLNDANIDVTTEYEPNTDGQPTIEKSVEDSIVNDLKKIRMELVKVAQHDNKTPVAGAKFKLMAVADDKTMKEVGVYTTDENGRIFVDGLEVGNYRFEEIEVPRDYLPPAQPNTDVEITARQEHGSTRTITVENEKKPQIRTKAAANGAKEVPATGTITLTDTVTYKDLIPGKEYEATLVWMDKSTGKPFMADGEELTVSKKFTPEKPDGEVSLSVEVDGKHFTKTTDLVAFESVKKAGIEVAAHQDLTDQDQTVTIKPQPPVNRVPQTGDAGYAGMITACVLSAACFAAAVISRKKQLLKN